MSIRVMTRVWDQSAHHSSALMLLLAIADFADDGGRAFPSVETLSKKIRLGERQTQNLVRVLEASGELRVEVNAGPHGANLYWVTLRGVQSSAPPVQPSTRRGAIQRPKGVQPIAPEPSGTINEPHAVSEKRTDDGKPTAAVPGVLRGGSDEYAAWLRANGWSDSGPSPALQRPRAVSRVAKQQLLGVAAPGQTRGQARFERETLRRGGPYEVQGKRGRSKSDLDAVWNLGEYHANVAAMLPHLKRMP